jgi:hypothetical protein
LCLEYGTRDDIFAGDQLDLRLLAVQLLRDTRRDLGVGTGKIA